MVWVVGYAGGYHSLGGWLGTWQMGWVREEVASGIIALRTRPPKPDPTFLACKSGGLHWASRYWLIY